METSRFADLSEDEMEEILNETDKKRWEKESNTVKGARSFLIVESVTSY